MRPEPTEESPLDPVLGERCATLALEAIGREHPFHLLHVVRQDSDVRPPRELHPSFHGAFDWHSAVHGHWSLARLLRGPLEQGTRARALAALDRSLTIERLAGEAEYVGAPGREGFERPYGLAWVLQLGTELRESEDAPARAWRAALAPLERLARDRLAAWLPRLPFPIRSGEHSQSAFAMGLALDWARSARDREFERIVSDRARAFHGHDEQAPIAYEPSGHDFLSPALGEADLMRRVLPPGEFAAWLRRFLPDPLKPATKRWLTPATTPDRADGKLAHLDGLNLSRAWMLDGIASALDPDAPHAELLRLAAASHLEAGIAGLSSPHYAGSHWLGSFAVYALTRRGVVAGSAA